MANSQGSLGTVSTDSETGTSTGTGTEPLSSPISFEISSGGLFDSATILHVAPGTDSVVTGGEDNDVIIGGAGNDDLNGDEGDDILVGGGGRNILEGGGGTDTFGHVAGAFDIVTDFSPTDDERLALPPDVSVTESQAGTVQANLGTESNTHNAEILTLSDGSTIALIGVTEQFSSDWLVGGGEASA